MTPASDYFCDWEGMTMEQAAGARARKFTPERIQQIINLVEQGKSRDEIADILEVTVGSLQVTCSRLGISLKRPKITNGVGLLPKRKPLCENASLTPHPGDHAPLQPTEDTNSAPDACSARFAISFQYRGRERTAELPFTPQMIEQLAMEAAVRNVTLGDLIAELITAMLSKGLVPHVPDNTNPAP
jgi:hypothetical protein